MKAVIEPLSAPVIAEKIFAEKTHFAIFSELIKLRLTTLVLLTTAVGFYIGASGPINWSLLLNALLGTALVAGGAAALNQLIEREHDAKMRRTEDRPLPSGRLQPETVLIFGGLISSVGLGYLAWKVNLLTSILGIATLGSYLFIYTPLKRVTSLNTVIGAIPGALPPLMGWTAARDQINIEGWALFAILFFWQLPHFLAIAWMYREDYQRGGFVMLPVIDPEGIRTGKQAVSHTLGLLFVSLFPVLLRMAGWFYCIGAILLGAIFLGAAIQFSRGLTREQARNLFFASIIYLPLLLGIMVFDKIKL
ncbi:MAG: heme o synthase [Verrucomicrobiota bacterium]